ncbi:hypothetical protein [Fimbriiglobus ruber]|uniref:Uncharacterized protein n=1 Tax=Fimbriiglobus ruber TaxID=1908690 RepID=A0A225DGZ4_9BACT|nr:hypothetical protein [Fimbriiglobus ruber]OWK38944.1 hypothetical protein FRUB_06320 [Fimbriiglobus ruber]
MGEDAKLVRRGRPGLADGSNQLTFLSKSDVTLVLSWTAHADGLMEIASALDELKLLLRRVRGQGLGIDKFQALIAARMEATKLARQASAAKAACDRLLTPERSLKPPPDAEAITHQS